MVMRWRQEILHSRKVEIMSYSPSIGINVNRNAPSNHDWRYTETAYTLLVVCKFGVQLLQTLHWALVLTTCLVLYDVSGCAIVG